MKRLRKFKTNRKLKLAINLIIVCYLSFALISYVTSSTSAYFVEVNEDVFPLQAGTWWDGSNLVFIENDKQKNTDKCPIVDISIQLENDGFSMTDSTTYEIYHVSNGDPKKNGNKLTDGEIKPISANGKTTLTYQAEEEGVYRFKVLQRDGHNYEYDTTHEIWSNPIEVQCIEPDTNEEKGVEGTENDTSQDITNESAEKKENLEVLSKDDKEPSLDKKETEIDNSDNGETEQNVNGSEQPGKEETINEEQEKSEEKIEQQPISKEQTVKEAPQESKEIKENKNGGAQQKSKEDSQVIKEEK